MNFRKFVNMVAKDVGKPAPAGWRTRDDTETQTTTGGTASAKATQNKPTEVRITCGTLGTEGVKVKPHNNEGDMHSGNSRSVR